MKRLLIVFLAIGIMITMSNIAFAGVTVDVVCDFASGQDCGVGTTQSFAADTYIFSIDSGLWDTYDWPTSYYSWSLFMDISGTTYSLGDGVDYTSQSAADTARNNNHLLPAYTQTVTHTGGDITFYVVDGIDGNTRDNGGIVTVAINVVPEPVSTILFITGGMVLGGRSYLRRKQNNI